MPSPFSPVKSFVTDFFAGDSFSDIQFPVQYAKELDAHVVGEHVADSIKASHDAGDRADIWGLEVLKHLVVINGAGLAGAFTLYQVADIGRSPVPAGCFVAGLLAAFLSLMFGWYIQRQLAGCLVRFAVDFQNNQATLADRIERVLKYRPLITVQIACATFSLVAFAAGVTAIFHLVDMPLPHH